MGCCQIFLDKKTKVFYDGGMGREDLEYEPAGVCLITEVRVKGRRRSVVDESGEKQPRARKQAWVLRGDTGSSRSPGEEPIILAAQRNADGNLEITVDELARLPFEFPGLPQALRRSRT